MKHAIVNNETEVLEIRDADAPLAGLPIRGTYGGGGIHAPVSDDPGAGWCRWPFVARKKPNGPQRAWPIVEARAQALKAKVPQHAAAIDARSELPASWDYPLPPSAPNTTHTTRRL